jgi:hypothetical protein
MNPFAPPTANVDAPETDVVFRPRLLPRDAWDLLILAFIAVPFQIVPLFGGIALIAYAITSSPVAAFFAFVIFCVVFLLFSVRSVCVQPAGIQFRRLLGTPKFIGWNELQSVRIATRIETVRDGWLWPLFPAREMSFGLSAKDHIRIAWQTGYCFFPPTDVAGFLALVRRYAPGA